MVTRSKELDYLYVLEALCEIPFGVGKKLLIDFLRGKEDNDSIKRNRLSRLIYFGSMAYEEDELSSMIDSLIMNSMIQQTSVDGKKFWKVLELTHNGRKEIANPTLHKKKLSFNFKEKKTVLTEIDRKVFQAFDHFLSKYNDNQKKAIICNNRHVLCIAGAGSGKTTVLVNRIEFIVKFRSVDSKKILAITFTRKARTEMMKRLSRAGLDMVTVETFNSFCEKILRKYNDIVYDRPVRVVTYRDKRVMMNRALSSLNTDMMRAVNVYFSDAQKRGKTDEQLMNIFLNDCFFVRDYFKFKNRTITESDFDNVDGAHDASAKLVLGVCNHIESYMKKHGLRDFADQMMDTIRFFDEHKELIPDFEHVLVDEYQDVNSTQIRLIDILNPSNLFCVGDPRQSIYGWRGSDIKQILHFDEKYPDCEIVTLQKNYRSSRHIVDFVNSSVRKMGLCDLESAVNGEKDIRLLGFGSHGDEFDFVVNEILGSDIPRNEIFVLGRTNKQINELSERFKKNRIRHVVKSDEMIRGSHVGVSDVTLATVHAIKGLEAEMVFVVGCNSVNYPCKGSEHPVIEMVKAYEYDKEEEERRLLYVAMSRAKKSLCITYTGKKHTYFITDDMLDIVNGGSGKCSVNALADKVMKNISRKRPKRAAKVLNVDANSESGELLSRLKTWRRDVSSDLGVPAFMVMHDRTLNEIANMMPERMSDLEFVRGLGPKKISQFGDDILSIVNG